MKNVRLVDWTNWQPKWEALWYGMKIMKIKMSKHGKEPSPTYNNCLN